MNYQELATQFQECISVAQRVVILQADNPDGDSLSSSLALEALLLDQGKSVVQYCAIDIPEHLRYLSGWDRIQKEFPSTYDVAILVDCGYWRLLGNFETTYGRGRLLSEKLIIINEHDVEQDIDCTLSLQAIDAVSSGQIVYEIAKAAGYTISADTATFIASSILADTLGLTSEVLTQKPRPFEVMADLVRLGFNPAELQEQRMERLMIEPEILHYKGELMQRVEFHDRGRVATITIPYDEIRERSQIYNPTAILDDARLVKGVAVMIGFKQYISNNRLVKVTGRIRCNRGYLIANDLAQTFPHGGGHPYAAGFKIEGSDLNFEDIKRKTIDNASKLLDERVVS